MKQSKMKERYWMQILLLFALAFILLRTSVRAYASEDRFRVTIYWTVDNDASSGDNKIHLYYWEPDGEGYKFADKTAKVISSAAKKTGDQHESFNLPGPPQSVWAYFHGSVTDKVQYYLTKVEVEPINPVANTGLSEKITLWEGKLGCSVATMFSSSLYNKLYFNNAPDGASTPCFSGWLDSDSDKSDKWGDDHYAHTDSYYKAGCKNPAPYGIAGFSINPDSSVLSVPSNNTPASYNLNLRKGILYDCFGAPWPCQSSSMSVSPDDKHLELYESDDSWFLKVNPDSNASTDYSIEITQNSLGVTDSEKLKIRTFDYNYTFIDLNGSENSKKTVDYGGSVLAPFGEGSSLVVWNCDTYPDWQNTTDGPQNRVVKAVESATQGKGTKEDPFRIKTPDDWERFVQHLDNYSTKGEYYKLENDITVNSYAARKNPFEGVFDGNDKTLNFNVPYDYYASVSAPFCKTKNATFLNLTIKGYVTTNQSARDIGGLIGDNEGETLIKNCTVSSTITGESSGGFVHKAGGPLTIEGCTYNGQLQAYDKSAGFVAFGSDALVLKDCLFDPTGSSWYFDGYTHLGTNIYYTPTLNATFVNGAYAKLDNCFYTAEFGVVRQGSKLNKQSSETAEEKKKEEQAKIQYQKDVTAAKNLKVGSVTAKAKPGKKALVTWKKNKGADGYQIRYSTNNKFKKSVKYVNVSKSKAKKTLTKLKAGKVWYVQIRTYKKIKNPSDGKTTVVYGKWSATKKLKAKK